MKDWLEAQLALVDTQMVGMDQAFLAYLQVDDSGRTLYASYKERESTALTAGATWWLAFAGDFTSFLIAWTLQGFYTVWLPLV